MSDLIGRFLSFEDHLGRGLVRVLYYVALFYVVVITLYETANHVFDLDIGLLLLVPFKFILTVLVLRVASEVLIAILSIDDHLKGQAVTGGGFEAGLTTSDPAQASTRDLTEAADEPDDLPAQGGEEPAVSTGPQSSATMKRAATKTATKKTATKKAAKKATKKATKKTAAKSTTNGSAPSPTTDEGDSAAAPDGASPEPDKEM
ncbi:heat shock protein HtpX [Parvularcula bermudensis HTCC2503]|uniref:Heat shock protein HtpX n=1 Tax=Parvularcula bermudensis (strain ATCC BAA-594 / HTCC2503 / KCTC 12087) TaxID=314260 RepID=E0TER1_PARBH|nr:DUF4282 domain-containing protein [Parvularcula bermudensis]ADM08944.1 heat shock protein HtpX [Parvularcula bermudensis HTCC2503]